MTPAVVMTRRARGMPPGVPRAAIVWMLAASCGFAAEDARQLVLPATAIVSKGPNRYQGDDLHITVGRGAMIGWYVQARREEEVRVVVEYSCDQRLDQEYQFSLDGKDVFCDVPATGASEWARVEVGRFTVRAGIPTYLQLVPPSGRKYDHPFRFRRLILEGSTANNLLLLRQLDGPAIPDSEPGFGQKLTSVHPALAVRDLRVDGEVWRVSGMALRGTGQLLFTTWEGDLYAIELDAIPADGPPPFSRLAQGLSEPMGLAVAGDRIFVTEKNEATELIDENGDGRFETYRCLSHDWPCTLDYHEYLFGAVVQDMHLYFASSVAMGIRGTHNRQAPLRGSVVKVHIDTGETEYVAGGLRTPDGMGSGPDGSILITDNQGEWLPANKLIHLTPGGFYQFRSRPPWHPLDRAEPSPPAVWLPQGEIAASPTQPVVIPESWGPYRGQVIFGDATFGGLQRAFLEEVDGTVQGAVFPFSQGFRHLFHRLQFAPDGDLFAGGIARGNDREFIERVSGLSRIRYTGRAVFEPLAARIRGNGLEIEFTQPLEAGSGWDPAGYFVTQWGYQATQTYGGAKIRHRRADVRYASVSADGRRVFLEIGGLVGGEVLHVRLPRTLFSADGDSLWAGELWYTVNRIPRDGTGDVLPAPQCLGRHDAPFFEFSEGNEGRALHRAYCAACHSLDGTRLTGPSFAGLAGSSRQVRASIAAPIEGVRADRAYLRQSILEPNARLVDGYAPDVMPPIGGMLSAQQLDQLIEYLVRVSNAEVARQELAIPVRTVRHWTMADFPTLSDRRTASSPLDDGAAQRGLQAIMKAQCLQCHRFSNVGAARGPDLTEVGQRYRGSSLLRQILEPSSEIHPGYRARQFLLNDGRVISGMVVAEDSDTYEVAGNLLEPTATVTIDKQDIEEQQPMQASAMPTGLLDVLTKAEVIDLLLFLEQAEERLGFVALSDGTSFDGWKQDGNWEIHEGAFTRVRPRGQLVYERERVPDDFELRFEWKASKGCNSGVYYRPGQVEYQVLDDEFSPYGENPRQSAAALFFCMAPSKRAARPHGERNTARILCKGSVIEHWLNDERVLSFDYTDPKWNAEVELLRIRGGDLTGRGGQLLLQDHGQDVAFRSLRWRRIPADEPLIPDPGFRPLPVTGAALEKEQARVRGMLEKSRQAAPAQETRSRPKSPGQE